MSIGLIGKKVGMTRIFDDKGLIVPVTVVQMGPCPVLQVKRKATDGYTALQLGFGEIPERKVNRPMAGHFKRAGVDSARVIHEFRVDDVDGYELGKSLSVTDVFEEGEKVDVAGISKGRGFTGAIKRHGASRGPESHGSRYHRRPGSMGASSDPSRVFKGKKLAGQHGNHNVTVQNLRVVKIDGERNLLLVRGAVPGHRNAYVSIAKAVKVKTPKGSK